MDEQNVGARLVHRPLEGHPRPLLDFLLEELDVVEKRDRRHARTGSGLQLLDGTLLVQLLDLDSHLLAEDLAEFTRHQPVVNADRARLRAAAANGAAITQLHQPGNHRPAGVDVLPRDLREDLAPRSYVLFVQAPEYIGAKRRPINLLVTRFVINRACPGTRLALRAVLDRQKQRLQESPVVFPLESLFESRQETLDQLALFFLRLGTGEFERRNAVQIRFVLLLQLVRELLDSGLEVEFVVRRRQRRKLGDVELDDLPFPAAELLYRRFLVVVVITHFRSSPRLQLPLRPTFPL